jgi:hypothetical protein
LQRIVENDANNADSENVEGGEGEAPSAWPGPGGCAGCYQNNSCLRLIIKG